MTPELHQAQAEWLDLLAQAKRDELTVTPNTAVVPESPVDAEALQAFVQAPYPLSHGSDVFRKKESEQS